MGRVIKERAELDAIEAVEHEAYDRWHGDMRYAYGGVDESRARYFLWKGIAERARADYYRG
jgi:hypothetical protein